MLNADPIAPQAGGFEPQRTYLWMVELYGIGNMKSLTMSMADSFLPERSNDPIEIHFMAEVRKVAGHITFANGQLVLNDYVDQSTYSDLLAWQDKVVDVVTGQPGNASDYKKTGSIILLSSGLGSQKSRIFNLVGAWPSNVSGERLSYDSNDRNKVNLTLTYDKAIPLF